MAASFFVNAMQEAQRGSKELNHLILSLPSLYLNLAKKKRTQRPKTQQKSTPDKGDSHPCPIPEVLIGGAEVSGDEQVDDGPGGNERTDSDQDVQRGGDDRYEENLEYDTQMGHGVQNEVASTTTQDAPRTTTDGRSEGEIFEIADWVNKGDRIETKSKGDSYIASGSTSDSRVADYQSKFLTLEFSSRTEQERAETQDPVEQIVQQDIVNEVVTSQEHQAHENEPPVPTEEPQAPNNEHQAHADGCSDILKLDFGRYKNIIYDKVDKLAGNVTFSQTALETNIIIQLAGHQHQLTTDLDMVKLQLAELVEHLKRVCDAKNLEGGQSRLVDGSNRSGGEEPSGGQSSIRDRGPSPRGGRRPSPGRYRPGDDRERFKRSNWF
ncbi:putative serine/threonine-protein kinase [Dorcoceras hygrometricum]|uniref:Putative serine/threonine-protein kinase n=1 Tax=Dorcoceras hygrometricum TaxID=472368 RepID=A0A2Z7DA70_9LAMI|nr:putative serine/threonine-protein kinase [Dorcoceras hygrometricum]